MTTKPNTYPGKCVRCGLRIEAGAGQLGAKVDGKWTVDHVGDCPTEAPCSTTTPEAAVVKFTPTAEQAECVKLFATLSDLVIQAGAGAGKTSTLLLLAQYAQANGMTGQYCAYNTAIVRDVAGKMPGNVNASTMHSLAFRAVGHAYKRRLDGSRQRQEEAARILQLDWYSIPFGSSTKTLAAGWLAGKTLGAVRRFCASADEQIERKHFEYLDGIDMPDDRGNRTYENNDRLVAHLLPFARAAWADLIDTAGQLRRPYFSHDVYLKIWQLGSPRINADFVLLDEAQDADPVQVAIIEAQRQYGTQIVVVGDEMQVLYEWRGAVDALGMFESMGARVAFLSQSFRFGDAVADVANGLLGRLDARLRVRGFGPVTSTVGPIAEPDAILCRSNAGAVRRVLSEIKAGRRPHLVGSANEIVGFCKGALALQTGAHTQHPELACFDNWTAVQEFVTNDERGDDLRLMVKLIDEFGAQVIIDALDGQASEADADVVISTAHKSKGREWNRVQIAADFVPPKEGDLSAAELRLAYVACTRAKTELDLSNVPHFDLGWKPGNTAGAV